MVTDWFPKHEIRQMTMMFGSQETIHATAYSYLNETLGLDDFSAFLHEPDENLQKNLNYLLKLRRLDTRRFTKERKIRQEVGRSLINLFKSI